MNDKLESHEKLYNEWLLQKTAANESMSYSIKRMDLLLISISGSVIYIVFQILQFVHTKDYQTTFNYLWFLKAAGALGVGSIILNFISQLSGLKTSLFAYNLANHKLSLLRNDKQNDDEFYGIKCNRDSKRKLVVILNNLSTTAMLVAVIFIVLFSIINL